MRTPTGQTGRDAYIYELAGMANKLHALKREWHALCEAIAADIPQDATSVIPIPSDVFPDATLPIDAGQIQAQISFSGQMLDVSMIGRVMEIVNAMKVGEGS